MGPPSLINEIELTKYGMGENVRFTDDIRLSGLVVLKLPCSPWDVITRCEKEDADFVVQECAGEEWHGYKAFVNG